MSLRLITRVLFGSLALVGILLAAGCGGSPSMPPEQVISKASAAIKPVNSFHFTFDASKTTSPMPGFFLTSATGDVAKPDKLAADVSATFGGLPINVKVVVAGDKQYMTDPASGKWQATSSAVNVMQFFDPAKGVSDILGSIKNPKDTGQESVGGTNCYKITGTVPSAAVNSLSPEVTATADLTTTLWIGTDDFLLRKVQLQGPFAQGEPADIVRTITFSDFNKTINVQTPVVTP